MDERELQKPKGLKIKEFLERAGGRLGIRTQEELASVLGFSDQTVSNWVKGKTFPTHETEDKLLKMGMTVEELFGQPFPSSAEQASNDFERKSNFFMNRLFEKIEKMQP